MSVYQYERDGQVVERDYRIGKAPRSIRVNGQRFNRRIAMPLVLNGESVDGKNAQIVSYSLGDKFNKYHTGDFKVGPGGITYPCFSSKRQREEFQARANADGHKLGFDRVAGPHSTSSARGAPG